MRFLFRFLIGIFLSFLINHKFGIFSVFFIRAYEKEIHVSDYSVAFCFSLKLTAELGLLIVKEFDLFSVWKSVFHIDKFTGKHV